MPRLAAPRRVFKRKRRRCAGSLALKIVLPLIAVSCVAYIVYWSREAQVVHAIDVVRQEERPAPSTTSDVKVQQVQYNGIDANNRPYSITAESASQPQKPETRPGTGRDPDRRRQYRASISARAAGARPPTATTSSTWRQLIADMTMGDGAWVAVTADNGVYHRDAGTVDLSGNVTLFHDTGLQLRDRRGDGRSEERPERSGDQPVEGQNPDGESAAAGLRRSRDATARPSVFTGRSYLKLYPEEVADGGGS